MTPSLWVEGLVSGTAIPPADAGVFVRKRVALSVAIPFNGNWTYCEFHPPVSRGGKVACGQKGPHLDELQMLGRSVPRVDHLVPEELPHLWDEWLDCCLNVFVRKLADRYPSDIEECLFKVL